MIERRRTKSVCCRRAALPPTLAVPRRLYSLHTHLTFCSTEFALMSEPSRRVPRSGLAGPERRPRVLRSSLAEPERRLARWGASKYEPDPGRSVLAPSACASAVSGALTSEKPFGSLLIANPVSRVLLQACT